MRKALIQGVSVRHNTFFDTVTVDVADKAGMIAAAQALNINLRTDLEGAVSVAFDETSTREDLADLLSVFLGAQADADFYAETIAQIDAQLTQTGTHGIPDSLVRESEFLTHDVFNSYHSETEMLRYIKSLEDKDLALNHSMISLGSCTMKLNAVAEMIPVTWPEFGQLHPFLRQLNKPVVTKP